MRIICFMRGEHRCYNPQLVGSLDQGGCEEFFQELPSQALDKHALWQQIIW